MTRRVVLITGCSTGIGRATALAMARGGARVYATMRAPERGASLRDTIAEERLDCEIIPLDVTDDDAVRAAIRHVVGRETRLDAVVNNAGVGPFAPVEHASDQLWLETLDTNLLGTVRVTRAALPVMRAAGHGTIVNVSSIAGRMATLPTHAAYAASKHAVCAFTDAVVAECSPFGVSAYCIEPGFFATAIMDKDTVATLAEDDPYREVLDGVEEFFRASLAVAPPPDAVAEAITAAIDGTLTGGVHHPIGVEGAQPSQTAARDA